jgi:hypothetical protein
MNRAFVSGENMNGQIDRLVSGDLDEQDRGPVIAWLEEDPRRWRLCGLLFLESQTWSQALAEWPCGNLTKEMPVTRRAVVADKSQKRRRQILNVAILAASVLLSFCLGFATRNTSQRDQLSDAGDQIATDRLGSPSHSGINPVFAELPVESSLRGLPQSTIQLPVVPKSESSPSTVVDTVPDYVRRQWERRGYQVHLERRYVFARLPGGQQVAVPIEQYSLKHVPPQIN